MGICVSPLYGHFYKRKILEWRLHHLYMGIRTVHWYLRDPESELEAWLKSIARKLELQDTYTDAPPLSPETYQSNILRDEGLSADQVCLWLQILRETYFPLIL